MIHEIKILPEYFEAVWTGKKKFEVRKNDRDYHVGDTVVLKEWNGESFTGYAVTKRISYMLSSVDGIKEGYCVFGIEDQ